MRRHAFKSLTASRIFRAVACTLLAVMALDAPARAFALAASGRPPAVAQSTAAKLADVPDSLPYDPVEGIAPTRSMWVDIKAALDNALGQSPQPGGHKWTSGRAATFPQ